MVSGRYGYPGPILSAVANAASPGSHVELQYWDYQVRGRWRFSDRDEVSAFAFGSFDRLAAVNTALVIEFHRLDLRWDHRTSATGRFRLAMTVGTDRLAGSAVSFSAGSSPVDDIRDGLVSLRTEWSDRLSRHLEARAGTESRYPQQAAQGATGLARATVDPRVTARWHPMSAITLVSAAGVAHEPSNIPLPSPGLDFAQLSRGVQTAYQYSEGIEASLPLEFSGTLTGFLHDYTGLADYYDSCASGGDVSCTFSGRAYGLELLVRRKLTERFTGWISYTLSRSERQYVAGPSRVATGLSEFDRTHVVNVVLAADLGAGWRAGARAIAYSGLPYKTLSPGLGYELAPSGRGPPFVRVDLRVQKSWHAFGGTVSLVFEWLNALLQKESISTTCSYDGPKGVSCTPQYIPVPITFPSIGIEGAWGE
jgi:hypothetical protein